MKTLALTWAFMDWLQKKFNLAYVTIIIRMGTLSAGVTDIDWNQHYKKRDFKPMSWEELARELTWIHIAEKKFDEGKGAIQ